MYADVCNGKVSSLSSHPKEGNEDTRIPREKSYPSMSWETTNSRSFFFGIAERVKHASARENCLVKSHGKKMMIKLINENRSLMKGITRVTRPACTAGIKLQRHDAAVSFSFGKNTSLCAACAR